MDVREIVRGIKERHGRSSAAKYDADSDNIPQRLLMPSSEDPSLWRVRVKVSLLNYGLGGELMKGWKRTDYHCYAIPKDVSTRKPSQRLTSPFGFFSRLTPWFHLLRSSSSWTSLASDLRYYGCFHGNPARPRTY